MKMTHLNRSGDFSPRDPRYGECYGGATRNQLDRCVPGTKIFGGRARVLALMSLMRPGHNITRVV